jgi:hypothetical protein
MSIRDAIAPPIICATLLTILHCITLSLGELMRNLHRIKIDIGIKVFPRSIIDRFSEIIACVHIA